MKNTKLVCVFMLFCMLFSLESTAQNFWKQIKVSQHTAFKSASLTSLPSTKSSFTLDDNALKAHLKVVSKTTKTQLHLPNANGVLELFSIVETPYFEAGLAAKFPNIKSYSAIGVSNPNATAKISIGTDGLHAVIYNKNAETVYVDPAILAKQQYVAYKKLDLSHNEHDVNCLVEDNATKALTTGIGFRSNAATGALKTYRLAVTTTGEYSNFHLTNQNIPTTATDVVKKAAVLSAINTTITRVNGAFENDLSVRMVLVNNNDDIIFLDAATDNFTDGDANLLIDQSQAKIDAEIGDANYDIGHVFSIGGDGLAGLGVVCVTGQKARGVTGIASPIGDPYDIDFVAHELGHQFGATHTQNNDCNRTLSTAVEPGSGSTIMGYAGICPPDVQFGNPNGNSDAYFHAVSIAQMQAIIASTGSCATVTTTTNTMPVANAGLDYAIPKGTPFVLKGAATDADGLASLTYNWEQIDNEVGAQMPPESTNAVGPMFRSLPSQQSPNRYLPSLQSVVSGVPTDWEVLPSVERDLNFSLLVRDNFPTAGATSRDDVTITVADSSPFKVTSQNAAGVVWDAGSNQTITWDKALTDTAPINCQNVNIKLSTDGGVTFPILLKANTANDGTEVINVPNNITTQARIMVEAVGNIFYNVNASNFEIQSSTPSFLLANGSGEQFACNTGNQTVTYNLNVDFINGFTETVNLAVAGNPVGSNVSFSNTTFTADNSLVMTISNLDNIAAQRYLVTVTGTSNTVTQTLEVALNLTEGVLTAPTLLAPVNNDTDVLLVEVLTWQEDTSAFSYDVEIAEDAAFNTVVSTGNVTENTYTATNLSANTTYFWRVKSKNTCTESAFSAAFSFTTEVPVYCASTFTDDAGGTEHITNVTFNSINNNSGNDTVDGYQDFTTINTNLFRAQTEQISVTLNTAGFQDRCVVFIDWNQDFVFDVATERYDLGVFIDDDGDATTTDEDTATFSITVPADAKFGTTRMRVVIEYDDPSNGSGGGPCSTDKLSEWGETEDYSITVLDSTLSVVDTNNYLITTVSESCLDKNDGKLNLDIKQNEYDYDLSIQGPNTTVTETITTDYSYALDNLSPGVFTVCLTATALNQQNCFDVVVAEAEQIALKAKADKTGVNFNIAKGTAPYSVFLDGKLLTTTTQRNFNLDVQKSGQLLVKTAKACEGEFATQLNDVQLLQNPIQGNIMLLMPLRALETKVGIKIFDVVGKQVYAKTHNISSEIVNIPFDAFTKGVYFLKTTLSSKPIKIVK